VKALKIEVDTEPVQTQCDLYLFDPVQSERLRFLSLYDSFFVYDKDKSYSGFVGVNIDRVKLVSVVSDLRFNGIASASVPIKYKDRQNIEKETAVDIATKYALTRLGASGVNASNRSKVSPVVWMFEVKYERDPYGAAGGVVMVDRVDGHVWSQSEYEEYQYDYNNVF